MKRFLSLLIILSILTTSLLTVALSVAADEASTESTEDATPAVPGYRVPVAGLYDDKLVAYHNFLGETAEEQLADKAPAGETDDLLSATAGVTITNGVATIPSTTKEYLSWESIEGDIADLNGKTIYLEFTAAGAATQYANDLLSFHGTFRYWLNKGSTTEKYTFGGGIGDTPTKAGYKFLADSSAPSQPAKDWYYLAISFQLTETELVITAYNSDNGTDYVVSQTSYKDEFKPENLVRTTAMLIGKATKTVGDRGMSISLNQLRLYNAVLTDAEVRNLSYITPGQVTEKLPEADEGSDSTVTTPEAPAVPLPERLPIAALYDENLVAYYDFNGDADNVKAHDKAPAGSTVDTLTFSDVVVNNGIAYVSSAKGSYLSINTKNGDTADLAGKTIYMVFTATGFADPYSNDILSSQGTFRYWLNKGCGDDNFKFGGGITKTPTVTGYKLTTNPNSPTAPSDLWYYVALTFNMTEDALVITAYNSANGKDYVMTTDTFSGDFKPENLARTSALIFGKAAASTDDRGISYYFDEIRVYDKVLAAEEIANLIYTVPGKATTLPQPPADTEDSTVTTEPEAPTVTTEPEAPSATTEPEAPTATTEKAPAVTTEKKPDSTKAPTAEPTPGTTEAPAASNEPQGGSTGGCKGALAVPFAIIALVSIGAATVLRKKD